MPDYIIELKIYYKLIPGFSNFDYQNLVCDALEDYVDTDFIIRFGDIDSTCRKYGDDIRVGFLMLSYDADLNDAIRLIREAFQDNGSDAEVKPIFIYDR